MAEFIEFRLEPYDVIETVVSHHVEMFDADAGVYQDKSVVGLHEERTHGHLAQIVFY